MQNRGAKCRKPVLGEIVEDGSTGRESEMYIHEEIINCEGRSDRIEIFPFGDCHIGKKNCAETAIKKQISEVKRRSKMPNRHVRVVLGGDQINAVNIKDIKGRFDFGELADWFVESDAETTRERLSDIASQEVKHAAEIFAPIQSLILGALTGNHEKTMKTQQNVNVHSAFCEKLGVKNFTDEAMIRITARRRSKRKKTSGSVIKIYVRHGYGSGRTAGAEPNKLERLISEWEDADVCLTGHTHAFCIAPPKPVLYIPDGGKLPDKLLNKHRFAANWGCWLHSHDVGSSTYESVACYPARPMMTVKVVIFPFWHSSRNGVEIERPKIELRQYPIL